MKSLVLASLLLSFGTHLAAAGKPVDTGPAYVEGSQYTAVLEQGRGYWRLVPVDASSRKVDSGCAQQTYLPEGVWLLGRGADGQPELIATSGTRLPPGHRENVRLAACEDPLAPDTALKAPRTLLEWLGEYTGAVYISR